MSTIHSRHPSYLLISKIKDSPDEVFLIDSRKRIKIEFQSIEHNPDPVPVNDFKVTGLLEHLPGLTGKMGTEYGVILHRILHHALKQGYSLWRTSCEAAGLSGEAFAIVCCDDGQIRRLIARSDGQYIFEAFHESTLYQEGRVLTKDDLMSQLRTVHYAHVSAVEKLFDPTKTDGFIMPVIN
jgi:hypothetical protein